MRWRKNPPDRKPVIGERRVQYCFAWLPIECNGIMVWLESVYKVQRYKLTRGIGGLAGFYEWETIDASLDAHTALCLAKDSGLITPPPAPPQKGR